MTRVLNDELEGLERERIVAYLRDYPSVCVQIRGKPQRTSMITTGLRNHTTRNLPDRKQITNYLMAICTFLDVSLLMFCLLVLQCYMSK